VNFGLCFVRRTPNYQAFMQHVKLFSLAILLFISGVSFAKGHGGGGHHGGGHGGHNGARSAAGTSAPARNAARTQGKTARRSAPAIRHINTLGTPGSNLRSAPVINSGRNSVPVVTTNRYYPTEYYYPVYNTGYSPYFNYPYFSMWSVGMGYMYTPNYSYPPPVAVDNGYGTNGYAKNNADEQGDNGYAVYARDTIRGNIKLKHGAVLLENTDSGRNYDYTFKIKQHELACVTMYNDDNKQLNLVRLKDEPKKLWRIVHEGKLNIYDEHHDFIYTPNDIDIRTLTVVYNGETVSLHSSSVNEIKERLTEYVNKAYGLNLDAKKFNWNELLIYIDKLD